MTRLDDKTVWFDYDALEAYAEDDVGLFCLSDRDLSLVLSCLRYSTWSARWYDASGKRLRDVGKDAELSSAIERSERLISRLMTDKCSDLSEVFAALVSAMGSSSGGCGCGSGGAGDTSPPPSVSDWGDVNDPPDPGTPPDGFSDWAEYRTYKCNVATWLLDNMVSDLQWLQTVDLVALSLAGLAAGLLTPVPGDELFAALGALLAVTGIAAGAIATAEDALTDDFEELVCALYEAENASDAEDALTAAVSTAVDGEVADIAVRFGIKLALDYWISFIGINKLFDRDEALESQFPTGDCSSCAVAQWWDCSNGSILSWTADDVDIEAVASGPDFLATCGLTAGPGFSSSVVDGTWSSPAVVPSFATAVEDAPPNVSCGDGSGSPWDFTSGAFVGGPHNDAARILHRSGTAFTVRFVKLT